MDLPLDWRTDPIVQIEDALLTLLSEVPLTLALGADRDAQRSIAARVGRFSDDLDSGFARVLGPTAFQLDEEAKTLCSASANAWRALMSAWDAPDAVQLFRDDCVPRSRAALDAVRRVFIGGVLKRQAFHAEQTAMMKDELSQLSEAIQFVSINASIEAARLGERGRPFALIADEIRTLAGDAQRVMQAHAA